MNCDKIAHSLLLLIVDDSVFSYQTCKDTQDIGALQKAADFVKAFTLGFEVDVSIILQTMLSTSTEKIMVLCAFVSCVYDSVKINTQIFLVYLCG